MQVEIKTVTLVENFRNDIESIRSKKQVNTLDAILIYCESNNIEVENIATLVKTNPAMKAALSEEAESLNFLPKVKRLI